MRTYRFNTPNGVAVYEHDNPNVARRFAIVEPAPTTEHERAELFMAIERSDVIPGRIVQIEIIGAEAVVLSLSGTLAVVDLNPPENL